MKLIYKNELDEVCFAHDTAYFDGKDLAKRTISDKILKDKLFKTTINPQYDEDQKRLASVVCKFLTRKQNREQA